MSCPPIIHRDASLNNVSTQLYVLEKKVFHLQSVIQIMDSTLRESLKLYAEVTECKLEAVKQLREKQQNSMVENSLPEGHYEIIQNELETEANGEINLSLNQRTLFEDINERIRQDIDKRIQQLRDDYLVNYESLLKARDAIFLNEGLVVLDEQKRQELKQTFNERLDEELRKSGEGFQIDDITDLNLLEEELEENFRRQTEEYNELFEIKQNVTMQEHDLRKELEPQFEELKTEKKRLLSQLEVGTIFTACELNDDQFLEQELAKLGNWNILSRRSKKTFVNQMHSEGFTPLHSACYHNHLRIVKILMENGADATALDKYGYQSIHWAAKQGAYMIVRHLLGGNNKKELVNARGEYGRTPLHMSVYNGRLQTTQLLIEAGANINAQVNADDNLLTPLHNCVIQGNVKMVQLLTSYEKLDVCVKDSKGFTPLYHAVVDGHTLIVEYLLNHQSWCNPLDSQDPNSLESLVKAPKRRNKNDIQRLLFLKFPTK
ncbi:ankyrin repeat domain-containing protein [Candidatus Protochlamydia amoebophila]|uniref:ankyrin repeat domain-containing protein n=1 Tax=Candidatus Protochlamydia amoebophila TaxID=362787 RepID=UPI001BC9B61E|nr:ankyrin repeat domain-containing protein [Candidatus Protochlamydia amoebophila]